MEMNEEVARQLREDEERRKAWESFFGLPLQIREVKVWHLNVPGVYETYILKEGDESWDQFLERIGIDITKQTVQPINMWYDVPGEDPNGE